MQHDSIRGLDTLATTLTYTFSPLGSGHRYRAPVVIDFTNMYGLVASSIVLDITNGYYGTATIPAEEILSSFVYFVRLPALLAVSLMVFTCICLLAFDLITSRLRESPVREMSFITVATATRGDWWDDQVDGLCCAPKSEMRRRTTDRVFFGFDSANNQHIGLTPRRDSNCVA